MSKIQCESVILKINLSKKEFNDNNKLRDLIDDFTTAVNDVYIDKFSTQMNFSADFLDDNTMVFTLDNCNYIENTFKIIDKLFLNKKYKTILNRKIVSDETLSLN